MVQPSPNPSFKFRQKQTNDYISVVAATSTFILNLDDVLICMFLFKIPPTKDDLLGCRGTKPISFAVNVFFEKF